MSLARGDYVGAALSFTSMIPVVGDAIGKSGKAARFIAKKGDDILATGRWIKCKVTGKGCFVAGTKVWVSARAGDDRAEPLDSTNGSVALAASRKITLEAIEAVAIGSRVSGENPRHGNSMENYQNQIRQLGYWANSLCRRRMVTGSTSK